MRCLFRVSDPDLSAKDLGRALAPFDIIALIICHSAHKFPYKLYHQSTFLLLFTLLSMDSVRRTIIEYMYYT